MACVLVNSYGRYGKACCLHLNILKIVYYLTCDVYEAFDLFSNLLSLSLPLSPDIFTVCFYLKYCLPLPLVEKSPSFTSVLLLVAFFLVKIQLLFFYFFTICFY